MTVTSGRSGSSGVIGGGIKEGLVEGLEAGVTVEREGCQELLDLVKLSGFH